MYVRLAQFNLGPGKRSAAQGVADKVVPAIRAQKGCERCEFFGDEATGDYGLVVLWASVKDADAAYAVVNPILQPALTAAGSKEHPNIRLFEVIEPKG